MGKKVFSNLSDTPKSPEVKETADATKTVAVDPKLDPRYNELNKLPLKSILKFIGAKQGESASAFVDKSGNTFLLFDNNWYCPNKTKGGEGAVSLFSYHLSLFKSVNYENEKNALMTEAINILEQLSLGHHIEEEVKPKASVGTKAKPKVKKSEPAFKAPTKKLMKKAIP